ncbi:IDEAL domain-containing protein [Effusibacillus consociatus]|uniref:IDEAL domain-containing protein n=1 Tax=Effusibacillus consociatus TaxID=1117041 RepID=A0ABV9Q1G2_9BACL
MIKDGKMDVPHLALQGVNEMLQLGQKIVIVNDSFEQNLPIGEYGYIIGRERNSDSAFDFIIRVPSKDRHYYVPAADIESEEVLIKRQAEEVERQALIDHALATGNKQLFEELVGKKHDESDATKNDYVKPEEFIRKVNVNAWI